MMTLQAPAPARSRGIAEDREVVAGRIATAVAFDDAKNRLELDDPVGFCQTLRAEAVSQHCIHRGMLRPSHFTNRQSSSRARRVPPVVTIAGVERLHRLLPRRRSKR